MLDFTKKENDNIKFFFDFIKYLKKYLIKLK